MALLRNVLSAINLATHSAGLRFLVNHKIKRYGHMTELTIDPATKTLTATLELKGEKEPITVRLTRYHLESTGSTDTLRVEEVYVSREWMQTLAGDMLQNKPIALPPEAAKWLKLLL